MKTSVRKTTDLADDYLKLIQRFPLIPIRNETHLQDAFKLIDELSIVDEGGLTQGQADYLVVLTDLVERFEDQHHPMQQAFKDGIAALKYLVDQNNMTASDLGRLLGNRQLGTAILSRRRQLSKAHIVQLAERFKVSTDLFLR